MFNFTPGAVRVKYKFHLFKPLNGMNIENRSKMRYNEIQTALTMYVFDQAISGYSTASVD